MSRKYCKRIQRQRPIQKKEREKKKKKKKRRDKNFDETVQKHINDSTRMHGLKMV